MERSKRILVAPLDWGLGHAARCIPIIGELLNQNHQVVIASNGDALSLLKGEFPGLRTRQLPGYNPIYPANGSMVWKMATQLPKFIRTIAKEHAETQKIVDKESIDAIISDNRYGCFSKKVKSVFITHQLHILMPKGYEWLEQIVDHFNVTQIGKYSECWVPVPDLNQSLIPMLTANNLKVPARAIGYLSRLETTPASKKYDLLIISSGPEPQRTIFEQTLLKELKRSAFRCLLVRGKPSFAQSETVIPGNVEVVDFMSTLELNTALQQSDLVIARPGYSMVMDMMKLGKNGIFIPTPGQTEQEYIAREMLTAGIAYCMEQAKFDLKKALNESAKFKGFTKFTSNSPGLKEAIASLC